MICCKRGSFFLDFLLHFFQKLLFDGEYVGKNKRSVAPAKLFDNFTGVFQKLPLGFVGNLYRVLGGGIHVFHGNVASGDRTHILNQESLFMSQHLAEYNGIAPLVPGQFAFVYFSEFGHLGRKRNEPVELRVLSVLKSTVTGAVVALFFCGFFVLH